MITYAILLHPGHNRVYFSASKTLSVHELTVALKSFHGSFGPVQLLELAGVAYLTFTAAQPLTPLQLIQLSYLSPVYALFRLEKQPDGPVLYPLALPEDRYMDPSVSSILKYTGKTNELFTRMMLGVAYHSLANPPEEPLRVLDPIAGKGTTLAECLIRGWDAYGVEIGEKAAAEAFAYLKKYLETEKYKHETDTQRISGPNRSFTARRYQITLGRNKEELKNHPRHWELVAGDSRYCDQYFRRGFFHLAVGDLPYGVQHGNVTGPQQGSLTRNPSQLVEVCCPAWHKVLVKGGILALSWNSFLLSWEELAAILERHHFQVLREEPYRSFQHRVDQAIRRDLILARKVEGESNRPSGEAQQD